MPIYEKSVSFVRPNPRFVAKLVITDIVGQADEHGLKRKFVSPSARKDT